jgi:hypothetical protein
MSKPAFTPGPWEAHDTDTGEGFEIRGPKGVLAFVESVDDAYLIESAPDLYAALANLENDDGDVPDHAWVIVQSALKKARGEA